MLVIYEIMIYQHWKKLFHLQGNRLKADESWNSIWYKKKKNPIVSKLIMNMLAKLKDNYDFKQNELPTYLGIMSQLERMILCQDVFGLVWKMNSIWNQVNIKKDHYLPTV